MITNYLGIIPRNLVKNRKRSMVLIISILFMVALITAGEILVRSIVNSAVERAGSTSGWYHGAYTYVPYDNIGRLRDDSRIDRFGISAFIGFYSKSDYKISINSFDDESAKLLNIKMIEGSLPKKIGEIIVEKWAMDKLFPDKHVGDRVTLSFEVWRFNNEFQRGSVRGEFLISGIIQDSIGSMSSGEGKGYIDKDTALKYLSANDMAYNVYFTVKDKESTKDTAQSFDQAYEKDRIGHYMYNTFYLEALDNVSRSGTVVLLLDIVISLAAAIMIYNIFNISIHERVKQFGLLKSIGITPSQIFIILLGEAALLSLLFVPLGIFLGVNITKILFGIIGGVGNNKIVIDSNSYNTALIFITGTLAVLLASIKPARVASKISPIQAINSSNIVINREIKNEIFLEWLIRRILGQTGKMAYTNLTRNKKKFFATVISITMGVMLFIGISYFINSLNPISRIKQDMKSNYVLRVDEDNDDIGYSHEDMEEIKGVKGISKVVEHRVLWVNAHLKAYNFTDEQRKEYERNNQYEEWFKQDIKSGIYSVMGYFVGCSSDVYKDILKGSSQVLQNRSNIPGVIIAEKIRNKKTVSLIPGDIIKITWSKRGYPSWEKYEREFMVEAVIENTPFKFNVDQGSLGIIGENGVIGDSFGLGKYQVLEIDTNNRANENEVEGRLKEIANNQKNGKLISYSSDLARYKKTVFQTAAVLYTLFAVAAIIVIVNIINTISMNILTRGREFGMLRALGMTKNQLRGMIIKEGIIYGAAGSIGGTLLGIGFCALIYKGLILQINYYDKFKVNYTSIILTFVIAMLLTACATIIPLKRATKLDVIESIRAIE